MKYTEYQLQSWTAPLSNTEEKKAENAVSMIKDAIKSNNDLKSREIEVFTQGSFANNTNVRSDSDVDICVMLKDVFNADYPEGKKRDDYGFDPSDFTFKEYRDLVKQALQDKFTSNYVSDGNKSLKIDENTYHVKADVVPSFQLRNYYYNSSLNPDNYVEGIRFWSKDGNIISNYPKRHIQNGKNKNKQTNYRYKKLVRIMKHIKNEMVADQIVDGDMISSFLVECLVYQIPDSIIMKSSSWNNTLGASIYYLYNEINEGRHTEWTEISGMIYLFFGRKWTDKDVLNWLVNVWKFLGYAD
jgi:hypothetical protein